MKPLGFITSLECPRSSTPLRERLEQTEEWIVGVLLILDSKKHAFRTKDRSTNAIDSCSYDHSFRVCHAVVRDRIVFHNV